MGHTNSNDFPDPVGAQAKYSRHLKVVQEIITH